MKVSVIIPVFNAQPYLKDCLDSVFAQKGVDLDVIAVDDGSTDGSGEFLDQAARAGFRVVHQTNQGQGAARNRALDLAEGDYVHFMDADDALSSDTVFERVVACMERDRLDVLFFDAQVLVDPGLEDVAAAEAPEAWIRPGVGVSILSCWELLARWTGRRKVLSSPCLYLTRRSFLDSNRLRFPEGGVFFEDDIFLLRLADRATRVGHRPWPFYVRKVHDNSTMTRTVGLRHLRGALACLREVRALHHRGERSAEKSLVLKRLTGDYWQALRSVARRMLFSKVGNGVFWTVAEKFLIRGVSFAQSIILARLLTPTDFGITAIMGMFIGIAEIFVDGGLGLSVIQSTGHPPRDERRVFRFNMAVAAAFYIALFAAAPHIATFYGDSRMTVLLRIMGTNVFWSALAVLPNARLTREMRFASLSLGNALGVLGGVVVALVLAVLGCGVWSIAISAMVTAAMRMAVLSWCGRGLVAPVSDDAPSRFPQMLRFGWRIAVASLLTHVYRQSCAAILGRYATPAASGLYARAATWSEMPGGVVADILGRVCLPLFVRRRDDLPSLRRARRVGAWLGALALWPVLALLWIFADEVIVFVLGTAWVSCAPLLRILLVGAVPLPFSSQNATLLGACGRSDLVLKADLWRRTLGLAFIFAGCGFGIEGLCWGKVCADGTECLVAAFASRKITGGAVLREALCL